MLLVEDDAALAELVTFHFKREDFDVKHTPDGEEALLLAKEATPDIVLLDWMVEGISGIEVCRRLRRMPETANVPIIMLTARGEEEDRVRGLETGADDYVTKPFGMNELAARIRVALRHRLQQQGEKAIFQTGGLSIDLVKRIVKVDGKEVKLSPKEYDILRVLAQHAGKVLTHQFLLKQVWGPAADVQYLRVYVRQLRQKVEQIPDQPQYITTETGVGYRLREPD
jgi:two-component system KDP operon response regulator KdpE